MPLGPGTRYRYKKGTKIRLAFQGGNVVEAKNIKTGATHTKAEFAADRAKRRSSKKTRSMSDRLLALRGAF